MPSRPPCIPLIPSHPSLNSFICSNTRCPTWVPPPMHPSSTHPTLAPPNPVIRRSPVSTTTIPTPCLHPHLLAPHPALSAQTSWARQVTLAPPWPRLPFRPMHMPCGHHKPHSFSRWPMSCQWPWAWPTRLSLHQACHHLWYSPFPPYLAFPHSLLSMDILQYMHPSMLHLCRQRDSTHRLVLFLIQKLRIGKLSMVSLRRHIPHCIHTCPLQPLGCPFMQMLTCSICALASHRTWGYIAPLYPLTISQRSTLRLKGTRKHSPDLLWTHQDSPDPPRLGYHPHREPAQRAQWVPLTLSMQPCELSHINSITGITVTLLGLMVLDTVLSYKWFPNSVYWL